MRRVTKENLITQIDRLYKIKDEQGQLSMNGEYNLQVYKMLLATMDAEPVIPDLQQFKEIYSIFCTPTTSSDNALSAIHKACRAAMLNK